MKHPVNYLILICLFTFSIASFSTEKIDDHHVLNPKNNTTIKTFNDLVGEVNHFHKEYQIEELTAVEMAITNWIENSDKGFYLKDFDRSKFYWQFVVHSFGKNKDKIGVLLIIPDNEIRDEFYKELGAGLRIPGVRSYGVHSPWVNDGEVFSFVVNRNSFEVLYFENWRAVQDVDNNPPHLTYYSPLRINYKRGIKLSEVDILMFVEGKFRDSIDASENDEILLPKGKTSTLVFYMEGKIKGVMCFNMKNITKQCPLYYETSVYLKDKFGEEKILYTEPYCQDIYEFRLMTESEFYDHTGIEWKQLKDYRETVAIISEVDNEAKKAEFGL